MKSLVVVTNKKEYSDPTAAGVMTLVRELGIDVQGVQAAQLYLLEGEVSAPDVKRLAAEMLADPVTQQFSVETPGNGDAHGEGGRGARIDVWLKPAVADPIAPSVERGARDMGLSLKVRVGQRFELRGNIDIKIAEQVAWRALANSVLHHCELAAL